jgi:hypothetical protein
MKKLSLILVILFITVIFCTTTMAQEDDTGFSIKGNLEFNTDYDTTSDDTTTGSDNTIFDQNGRIKVTPHGKTQTGNLYFEAQADIMANLDATVGLDDVWGKIGTDTFDIQIGRFEGIGLFDKPEDTKIVDAPNAPERYEANAIRGRLDKPGQFAIHIIPNDTINVELGAAYGTLETEVDETPEDETDEDATHSENLIGLRPVVLLTFGAIETAVGMDYQSTSAQDDDAEYDSNLLGFGGRVKATFGPASFSIEYASKTEGGTDFSGQDLDDVTTNSMGGVALVTLGPGMLGGGVFYTTSEIDGSDNTQTHTQYYVSYGHPLLVDNVTIKYALGGATADDDLDSNEEGNLDSSALGFRVRLVYDF